MKMRLFIAIQLEDNIKAALSEAQNELRKRGFIGRYTDLTNTHLTLAFIGEYNDPDSVLEATEQVRIEPFEMTLGGYIGSFGDLLWAGIEREPLLDKLAKRLRHALAEARIPYDRKSFAPHITLLRNAKGKRGFSDIEVSKESMPVCRISLMRSELGKHGAVYTEITGDV